MWNRDFLLLWQGMAESRIGSVLYSIAIGIWVYDQTDSAALMGIMTSLSYFGALVLQPFGGALADRCSKRALIVGSDAACGVAMLALGILALRGAMQVWQVLAVAAVSAVCTALFQPAVNSLIPQLVPAGDLLRASSLINGTGSEQLKVSQYLKRLKDDGFVTSRRQGRFIIYDITPGVHKTCIQCIHKRYDSLEDKNTF